MDHSTVPGLIVGYSRMMLVRTAFENKKPLGRIVSCLVYGKKKLRQNPFPHENYHYLLIVQTITEATAAAVGYRSWCETIE